MIKYINILLIGLFYGTVGTTLGGVIGAYFNIKSRKMISFILEFAGGLMTSVVCFTLIPESLELTDLTNCLFGIFLGIITMIISSEYIERKIENKKTNILLKTGLIVGIGLAIHNFPEGIAIGSSFIASKIVGYSIAISILLHDIPEGLGMAIPLKKSGMSRRKIILYTFLSGVTTGIGAVIGNLLGNISNNIIGIMMSFSSGAMLYIVSGEIIIESKKIYKGRFGGLGNILGMIVGIFVSKI